MILNIIIICNVDVVEVTLQVIFLVQSWSFCRMQGISIDQYSNWLNLQSFNAISLSYIFIPPENARKSYGFLKFSGIIDMQHLREIG